MKKRLALLCAVLLACWMTASAAAQEAQMTTIELSDEGVLVNGAPAPQDESAAVYTARDIVYYPAGQDFTFGEGTEADAHTQEEADAHTVVHISRPGTYLLSGKMSAGQIAVDADGGKNDPEAVVTLVLAGVDITCTVAPAVIFYNVYECGNDDPETATMDVDLTGAGANVVIADGTVNSLAGAYVARIYDPDTVELSEDGTEVKDASKLHKYDGTLYSKRSMNVFGGERGDGVLNITAQNEGLCSDLHLAIHGGVINILSGDDGINASEDGVSVALMCGGEVNITVADWADEGDGVDSNGWLVLRGGSLTAAACGKSADAGVDADKGVYVDGGRLCASGGMLERLFGSAPCAVFSFSQRQSGGSALTLRNAQGDEVAVWTPKNDFSSLVVSGEELIPGEYTLWQGETQLACSTGGGFGGMPPMGGFEGVPPEMPEGFPPDMPEGVPPDMLEGVPPDMPEGFSPEMPQRGRERTRERAGENPGGGGRGRHGRGGQAAQGEPSTVFVLTEEGGTFTGVGPME